ncbi:MAG TPA: CotH kinase family protein [Verrucomicrobiales bacterium]|nr:CotH kinase family protein [Verrucomicrobiales bacterium]
MNGSVAGRPVPADYEMKPALVNADPEGMMNSLRSLPTLSIAGDPEDLFGVNGILQNPFGPVDGSGVHNMNPFVQDRPVSIEWIDPQNGPEFQTGCGIRINGGWSRHYIATPKKSFTLLFRSEFGPRRLRFPLFPGSPLESFDRIVLKGIFSNAWPDAARPPEYLRDQFLRDTMLAMGQPSSRGTWAHVYLNGLYWGIYNPSERPDASFAASHFGGNKEEYDAIKHAGLSRPGVAINDQSGRQR